MARHRGSGSHSRDAHREDELVDTCEGASTSWGKFLKWDERTLYFAPLFHISERLRLEMTGDRIRCHGLGNAALIGQIYDLYFCNHIELR